MLFVPHAHLLQKLFSLNTVWCSGSPWLLCQRLPGTERNFLGFGITALFGLPYISGFLNENKSFLGPVPATPHFPSAEASITFLIAYRFVFVSQEEVYFPCLNGALPPSLLQRLICQQLLLKHNEFLCPNSRHPYVPFHRTSTLKTNTQNK